MRILFTALVLIIANYASAQQVNPVPDYVFSNRMSVGRNTVTDTAAYFSIGPRYGANKGFMPPIVGDTAHVTASNKRNGLLIFSVQKNKFLYWDSVRVQWSDMAGSSGSYIVAGDTAAMLSPYVRHAGYGLTKSGQSFLVDTAAIATRARVQKGIDSVAGLSRITGSGTTNYVPKFTGSTALGNSVIYDDGSNIGIGTTTPGNKLQVSGSTRLNGWTFGTDNSVTPTDTTGALYFRNGTTNAVNYSISYVRDLGITPSLAFQNSASPGTSMFLANNYIKYMNGVSTTMLLNSNNEVQIGSNTDLGDYKLQVTGSIYNTTGAVLAAGSGEVLIGTSTDAGTYSLQVNGNSFMQTSSGNAVFTIQAPTGSSPFIEYKRGTSQTWWVGNGVNADNHFAFYDQTNNAFRMTLKNDGELLIGTTTDAGAYALQVAGSMYTTGNLIMTGSAAIRNSVSQFIDYGTGGSGDLYFRGGSGFSNVMTLTNAGNVGIGTSSPSVKLDIGTTADQSFGIKSSTSNYLFAGTYQNYAIFAVNRNPSTGVFTDANKATADIAIGGLANDGVIIFNTTASNNSTATERIRIHSNGGLKFVPQSAAPTAEAGTVYYDSDDNKLKVYNGTTWVDLH